MRIKTLKNKVHYLIPFMCLILYGDAFDGGFRYDDIHSIVENSNIRSLNNILGFFFDPNYFSQDPTKSMYRPFLLVTFALNFYLSGYETWSYHLVNILLHAACTLCVFFLGKRIIGGARAGWIAGLCFLCHPIATEVVNYISSRSESLSAFFYLLCVIYSLRDSQTNSFAQCIFYVSGLLSKSIVITAPITVLMLNTLNKNKKIYSVLGLYGILAMLYIALIYNNRFLTDSLSDPVRSPLTQFWTQLKAPAYYLYLAFVPVKLSIHHPFIESYQFMSWPVLFSMFFVFSISILAWKSRKKIGGWALGWMGIALLPTFVMPLNMLVNERRLYLPLAAMALSIAWILLRYRYLKIVGFVTIIIWSSLTLQRTSVWGNEILLWEDANKLAPNEHNVQNNFGKALQKYGYPDEAMSAYKRALSIDPSRGEPANNIATLYHQAGERLLSSDTPDSARTLLINAQQWYHRAKSTSSQSSAITANLAASHVLLGELDSAYQYFEESIKVNSKSAALWNNYGQALYDGEKLERAQKAFNKALQIDSALVEPRNNLGNIFSDLGKFNQSEKYYRSALVRATGNNRQVIVKHLVGLLKKRGRFLEARKVIVDEMTLDSSVVDLYIELVQIELASGNLKLAKTICDEAINRYPNSFELYILRAEIYVKLDKIDGAINDFRIALKFNKKSARAFYGLGEAYRTAGNNIDAARAFKQFLILWPPKQPKSVAVRKWLQNTGKLN